MKVGDGGQGWPDSGPYDKIVATAAPELVPPALLQLLRPGGRLVIPAGLEDQQQLLLMKKGPDRAHVLDRDYPGGLFARHHRALRPGTGCAESGRRLSDGE